jgi:hypothetical protein
MGDEAWRWRAPRDMSHSEKAGYSPTPAPSATRATAVRAQWARQALVNTNGAPARMAPRHVGRGKREHHLR